MTGISELITDSFGDVTTALLVVFAAAFALTGLVVAVKAGVKWVKKIGASG
ncbi:MAG: hypothetical protein LBK95_11865 [Bifidobacteriaceae bacterium]|jgi:hypothetical protein|nr:hypothetical protein [Bifidobacteriaceae bacterium]